MSDFITVLQHNSIPLTKIWVLGKSGKPQKKNEIRPKNFEVATGEVDSLEDLYEFIKDAQHKPGAAVIRGQLIPGRGLEVQRTKRAKGEVPAFFRDAPHSWMLVDIDWHEEFTGTSEQIVNAAITKLPFELRTAGVVWQFSASAGFSPGTRLHLWFWLDRPLNSKELRRWAENVNDTEGKTLIDPALMDEIQLHFTANPVLEGLEDPIPVRLGYTPGPPAAIPRLTEKRTAYKKHLEPLYSPKVDKIHDHIMRACASYFCAFGPDADGVEFRAELLEAVGVAEQTMDREDYPESRLDTEIESGREFARNKAVEGENLLTDSKGEIRSCDSNARAILLSSPVWRDVLAQNRRSGKAEFVTPPPWSDDVGEVVEADGARLGGWFHKEFRIGFRDSMCWDAIQNVAAWAPYDPVEEFLGGLVWDGARRLDTWLSDVCSASNRQVLETLGAEAEREYLRRVGRMVLISGVARALTEGSSKVDTVMVLEGEQGARKSSMLEVLAGEEHYTAHNDASANERDMLAKFYSGAWILEFKELVSLGRGVDKVKALLDAKTDAFRKAYRRDEATHTRRCIAIATTNSSDYLEDITGNRRFWPVQVGNIDLALLAAIRDQLWAEAVVAWRAGEPWWTEAKDELFCTAQDGAFRHDSWEDSIKQALDKGAVFFSSGKPVAIPSNCDFVTIREILLCVFRDEKQTKADQMRVANVLKKLGWNRKTSWAGETYGKRGWSRDSAGVVEAEPSAARTAVDEIKQKRRIFNRNIN